MNELRDSLSSSQKVLLNEGSSLLGNESLGVNLSLDEDRFSMGSLEVFSEESADFSDDSSSFFVFSDLDFEFIVLFLSFLI